MSKEERIAILPGKVDNVNKILVAHGIQKEDREDLLQEIFLLAFRSIEKLRETEKMDSWLWTIAENRVNVYFKEISKRRRAEVHMEPELLEQIIAESKDYYSQDQVAQFMDGVANRENLRHALRQLDRDTKTVLNLHYGLGYKLTEIAMAQGKNYSSVKSVHVRGLKKLRRLLEEEGVLQGEGEGKV